MECDGQLKGDPDIAGIGVVTALVATTIVAIIISGVLWLLRVFYDLDSHKSRLYSYSLKLALLVSDIQLITALSLIIATIIQIKANSETSLYHLFCARSLVLITLAGHGAALNYDTNNRAYRGIRLGLLTIAIALWSWTGYLSLQEFWYWDTYTPKCFLNDNFVPGTYELWMKIDLAWTPLSLIWVYLEELASNDGANTWRGQLRILLHETNRGALDLFPGALASVKVAIQGKQELIKGNKGTLRRIKLKERIAELLKAFLQLVAFLLAFLVVCPPSLTPFTASFFCAWSTYDVYRARASNRPILVVAPAYTDLTLGGHANPEDDWGYGQVLPLLLLLLPILQAADTWEWGERSGTRVNSMGTVQRRRSSLNLSDTPPSPATHGGVHLG